MKRRCSRFVILGCIAFFLACTREPSPIVGVWDSRRGKLFVFRKDKTALWITESERENDTIRVKYRYRDDVMPHQLDLYDIQSKLPAPKGIYGIVNMHETNWMFTCDFEPGDDPSVRPDTMHATEKETYWRVAY